MNLNKFKKLNLENIFPMSKEKTEGINKPES